VNDGAYGSMNCLLYDHATVTPVPLRDTADRSVHRSSFWGPTCDSLDKLVDRIDFPEANIGDWIVFENMGAYTIAAGSCFNGFPRPMLIYTFSSTEFFEEAELPESFPVTPRIQTMIKI